MLFSLEGMNALVTGGSGSIGNSIARSLAAQGANVAITGTRLAALENVANSIQSELGKKVAVLPCNLSKHEEVNSLIKTAEEQIGSLDILINNAGINKDMLLMKMTETDFEEVLTINLKAAFTLSKNAILSMASRRFGRIINMTSVVGFTGNPGQVNYCASKAGLIGMSKAMALEYAKRNITINCIAPGAIESPMIDKISEKALETFLIKIPLGRIGKPEEIAAACCFLSSKEASYITGQTIHINGGMFIA